MLMSLNSDVVALAASVFTAVTAFAALWTAWEARKAVVKNQRTAEAHILSDFLKEYSSPIMLRSLRDLRRWKEKYRDGFAVEFEKLYKEENAAAIKLNRARREVSHYFQRALQLCRNNYVSKQFMEVICGYIATSILFDVVEPLEEIVSRIDVQQPYNKQSFDELRAVYKGLPK
jgi:hypothetical protein